MAQVQSDGKRRKRATSAATDTPASPPVIPDPVIAAVEPKLRQRATQMLASHHLSGASIGIVHAGTLAWSAGLGFADFETERRPDENTVYRVASISKTFTSVAILQLRDRGLLSLDDALAQHIPEFSAVQVHEGVRPLLQRRAGVGGAGGTDQVTLRRLLSHRSGLITEGPFSYWDSKEFPEMAEILAALPRTEIVLAPDAGAKYSNLAFALLGEVVARLSGEPFPQYVRTHIFEPLGMTSSSFEPDETLLARMAVGYGPHPYEDRPEPAGHTPTRGIAAAAGLYTTVSDLAKWIGFQLSAARPAIAADSVPTDDELETAKSAHVSVLSPRTLDEMHTPQALDADWTSARCLGWFGARRREHVVIGHGGSIHGFITQVYFHKSTGTGVIVLTNEGRHQGASPAALDLLDIVLEAHKAQPKSAKDSPPTATPPALRRFIGLYRLWGGSLTHVEFREGSLVLAPAPPDRVALHAPSKLAPTSDPLVYRVQQARGAGEVIRFVVDETATSGQDSVSAAQANDDARVTGFTLSGFQYTKLT